MMRMHASSQIFPCRIPLSLRNGGSLRLVYHKWTVLCTNCGVVERATHPQNGAASLLGSSEFAVMDDAGREDVGVEASQPPQPMPPWMATAQRAADAAAAAEITKVASNNGALLSDAPREASLLNLKELPRTGKRGAPQAFPHLLFLMLERESSDVIRWTQEGRAFVSVARLALSSHCLSQMISDLSAFIANTLMKYFRHSRYASFQRQLNLYGFRKNESGAFEHKFFVRENPELLTCVPVVVRGMTPLQEGAAIAAAEQVGLALQERFGSERSDRRRRRRHAAQVVV